MRDHIIEINYPEKFPRRLAISTILRNLFRISFSAYRSGNELHKSLATIVLSNALNYYSRRTKQWIKCGMYCPLAKSAIVIVEEGGLEFLPDYLYKQIAPATIHFPQTAKVAEEDIEGEPDPPLNSFARNWWMDAVHLELAQELQLTGDGVKIAVLDTGIHKHYKYLTPRLELLSKKCIEIDKDFNQCDANVYQTTDSHGTQVAALISSSQVVDGRVLGIAPGCTLIPIRVAQSAMIGSSVALAASICAAVKCGAQIIVCTFLTSDDSEFLNRACKIANKDVAMIFPASYKLDDHKWRNGVYPIDRDMDNMLVVGASIDSAGVSSSFVDKSRVNIIAPGVGIHVPKPESGLEPILVPERGTSFSTPIVGGLLALAHQYFQRLRPKISITESLAAFRQGLDGERNQDNHIIASLKGLHKFQG